MGLGEGIRECVADVGVQTADINSAAVTSAKVALDVGRWATGSWVSGSQTVFTASANCTVMMAYLTVTAAAAGLVTLKKSGGDVLLTITSTVAMTGCNMAGAIALCASVGVVTATNSVLNRLTAGDTVLVTAANSTAGKYAFFYISDF